MAHRDAIIKGGYSPSTDPQSAPPTEGSGVPAAPAAPMPAGSGGQGGGDGGGKAGGGQSVGGEGRT